MRVRQRMNRATVDGEVAHVHTVPDVLKGVGRLAARPLKHHLVAAGVVGEEGCDVVHLGRGN